MKVIEMKNKIISYLLLGVLLYPPLALSNGPRVPVEESSGFSFDIVTNFFKNLTNTPGDGSMLMAPRAIPADVSTDISEIILNTNKMTSSFSNLQTNNMRISDIGQPRCTPYGASTNPFGGFDSFMLCSKSGIYREHLTSDEHSMRANSRWQADNYVLQLDPENITNYCNCVSEKPYRYNVSGEMNSQENLNKRAQVINNLLRTGIEKLADRFNKINPKVMYALTSSEMASLHMGEKIVEVNGRPNRELVQRSVLHSCGPGQFETLMYEMYQNTGRNNSLCNEAGAKRLGAGFIKGVGHDCSGEKAQEPHCLNKSTHGLLLRTDFSADDAVKAIGAYVSSSGTQEVAELYLNRHYTQLEKRGEDVSKSSILKVFDLEDIKQRYIYAKNDKTDEATFRRNTLSDLIQESVSNEMSSHGQKLWELNNGPILKALELYSKNNEVFDDQITGNLDFFKEQVYLNPYLAKYFTVQGKSDKDIKEQIINFVKGPLKDNLAYVMNDPSRQADKPIDLNDLNSAMFLAYKDEYYEVVKECEDIQKSLISLCQAATNYGPEVDRISDFFTDPNLVKLFNADHLKVYEGEDIGSAPDLLMASGMFCQELNRPEAVERLNNESINRHRRLNNEPFFAGMRNLRDFLKRVKGDEETTWADRTSYMVNEVGGQGLRSIDMESLSKDDIPTTVRVAQGGESIATIKASSVARNIDNDERESGSIIAKKTESLSVRDFGDTVSNIKALPVDEAAAEVVDTKSGNSRIDLAPKPESQFSESAPTSFLDNFVVNPTVPAVNPQIDNPQEVVEDGSQMPAVDPIQAELLAQLERMRAREEEMARQIAELKQNMEDEKDQRKAEEFEREQKVLKDRVESLTAQLNERKAEVQKAAVTPAQSFTGSLGGNSASRPVSSAPRVQPTASAAAQNTAIAAPAAAPAAPSSRPAQNSINSSNNLASGNGFGLISSQAGQSSAVRAGQRLQSVTVAAGETNLATIARSVDGNTALRQTSDPDVLEKIIFKEVDGEIVFVNGQPVIERTELLTVEEAQMLEENEAVAMEEVEPSNERAPASIEEQMEEIEQSLYPRSRVYSAEELADEINRGRKMQD